MFAIILSSDSVRNFKSRSANANKLGDSNGIVGTGSQNLTWSGGTEREAAVIVSIAPAPPVGGISGLQAKYWG